MKKWSKLILGALLLLIPMGGRAEEAPDLLSAVAQGLSEGLSEGLLGETKENAQELTLSLNAADARIEEGHTLLLSVTAGNPYPDATDVTLTLDLPQRLSCAQPLTWTAQLAAATLDPQTGEWMPSTATFTREVTLTPGGDSEETELSVEMAMGTRFYRAKTALALCVPHISAKTAIDGAQGQLVQPGDAFAYEIHIANDGTAPKDVPMELILPAGVTPVQPLPAGFALRGRTLSGAVRAEATSESSVRLPMQVDEDALEDDEDASRLLCGVLTVDGARVGVPMLRAVGPLISARLIPQKQQLELGETMDLTVTVANLGLAPADVRIACLLPQGLSIVKDETETEKTQTKEIKETKGAQEETEVEATLPPAAMDEADDAQPPQAEAVMAQAPEQMVVRQTERQIDVSLHMDAATQAEGGNAAATKEITLRVRADAPVEDVHDRLLGASLAWRTDDGETQLGEAVAFEINRGGMMGLSDSEWNGILLAALLMLVTVCCLYSALKSDKEEEYCFD